MDHSHEYFFRWSVLERTSLHLETAKWRINFIKKACRLDTTQLEAYEKSLFHMAAGMTLVQGPPCTEKSYLCVAIIASVTSLGFKVLLTAGSNKAVENLSTAIAKVLNRNPEVKTWCGEFVRARTPGYRLSLFHQLIVGSPKSQGPAKNKTGARYHTRRASGFLRWLKGLSTVPLVHLNTWNNMSDLALNINQSRVS